MAGNGVAHEMPFARLAAVMQKRANLEGIDLQECGGGEWGGGGVAGGMVEGCKEFYASGGEYSAGIVPVGGGNGGGVGASECFFAR